MGCAIWNSASLISPRQSPWHRTRPTKGLNYGARHGGWIVCRVGLRRRGCTRQGGSTAQSMVTGKGILRSEIAGKVEWLFLVLVPTRGAAHRSSPQLCCAWRVLRWWYSAGVGHAVVPARAPGVLSGGRCGLGHGGALAAQAGGIRAVAPTGSGWRYWELEGRGGGLGGGGDRDSRGGFAAARCGQKCICV